MAKTKMDVLTRNHIDGLTLAQQSAIDLLVAGKTDTEAATLLSLHRTTITKWRLYSPDFQAALNIRRAEVWGSAATRLRSLIPQAVNVLAEALENGPEENRVKLAMDLLKLTGLPSVPEVGPFDPNEILRQTVLERRRQVGENHSNKFLDSLNDLPDFHDHVGTVRAELESLANSGNTPEGG